MNDLNVQVNNACECKYCTTLWWSLAQASMESRPVAVNLKVWLHETNYTVTTVKVMLSGEWRIHSKTGPADDSQEVKRLHFTGHLESLYNHDVVHWFTGLTATDHTEHVF